jgi:hypothetical protein
MNENALFQILDGMNGIGKKDGFVRGTYQEHNDKGLRIIIE